MLEEEKYSHLHTICTLKEKDISYKKKHSIFCCFFNLLNIIPRFLENSAVINYEKKKTGRGAEFILVCGILNKCNPFTYVLLLKVITSLNKEKITTKVLKFTIHCSHRYLKKKIKIPGQNTKVDRFTTMNFRSQAKQYIYLLSYYVSQEWLHFSQSKGHAKICCLRGNKMPAVFKDSSSIPCLNCNCNCDMQ